MIEDELSSRDIFLVILTPDAWASDWVREELALALASKKRIVGVMVKHTPVTGFIVQRQMINVVGASATVAAQQVASGLEVREKPAEAPARQAAAPQAACTGALTGKWYEANDSTPWVFDIAQSGQSISGKVTVGSKYLTEEISAGSPISGQVNGEDITIEFDISSGVHYTFRLRITGGELVGTKMASNFNGGTGLNVKLIRRQ